MKQVIILFCCLVVVFFAKKKDFEIYDGHERPPFVGEVLILTKPIPSDINYTIIGEFQYVSIHYGSTDETNAESLVEASEVGANGIIIEKTGHRPSGWSWAAPYTEGKLVWINNYDKAALKIQKTNNGVVAIEPSNAPQTISERLKILDELYATKMITESEYQLQRSKILNSL